MRRFIRWSQGKQDLVFDISLEEPVLNNQILTYFYSLCINVCLRIIVLLPSHFHTNI